MISPWIIFILILFLSYLTGSTPTSIIVGRFTKGIDIREHGSGNAGGTNVFRVLGWKPALIVVLVDVFKGWISTAVYAEYGINYLSIGDIGILQILCGFSAVLGHTYPLFSGFKGGKGVGTLGGMLIALFPIAIFLCLLVFAITLILTGYVSLGSIIASSSLPIFLFTLPVVTTIVPPPLSLLIFSLLIPWFVIYTHRSNVSRIRNGTENQFKKAMIFRRNS
ncbi:MAG: acyl-phosphate glycerol 3-phosphate acyltransferase [Candidatus Marinimicrobia bacterium]|nr:acyl-phosphate glycerol 3-phosphate acyltransferase [Candidatus Neomarinimicrobiota bacterium]|tara:strand:- start:2886 stop:3551 length:666 start_codon:yes stop_codon:yes gene_type:complete